LIVCGRFLLDYVTKDGGAVAALGRFAKDWGQSCRQNSNFQTWSAQQRRLNARLRAILKKSSLPDHLSSLRSALVSASARLDPDLGYTPPSPFDEQLEEYIRNDPFLMSMLAPAALIITDGTPASLMSTVGELNKAILGSLGITGGPPVSVVYISLVRILFAVSYTQSSGKLAGDYRENCGFLIGCELFARQSVRQLNLGEAIAGKYIPGLPIVSMFNSKQFGLLRQMEWMTNPIDLLYCVNQGLLELAKYFASDSGFLSFDDTLGLLLALLSIAPPSNAIGIASFLRDWRCVTLSQSLVHAENFFSAAVEHIGGFAIRQLSG
jgi:hypothetical protein